MIRRGAAGPQPQWLGLDVVLRTLSALGSGQLRDAEQDWGWAWSSWGDDGNAVALVDFLIPGDGSAVEERHGDLLIREASRWEIRTQKCLGTKTFGSLVADHQRMLAAQLVFPNRLSALDPELVADIE